MRRETHGVCDSLFFGFKFLGEICPNNISEFLRNPVRKGERMDWGMERASMRVCTSARETQMARAILFLVFGRNSF